MPDMSDLSAYSDFGVACFVSGLNVDTAHRYLGEGSRADTEKLIHAKHGREPTEVQWRQVARRLNRVLTFELRNGDTDGARRIATAIAWARHIAPDEFRG